MGVLENTLVAEEACTAKFVLGERRSGLEPPTRGSRGRDPGLVAIRSVENITDDPTTLSVDQRGLTTVSLVDHLLAMQPKQVHQGGMVIVMVDDVGDRTVSEFIGFPVGHTTLEATAGDPHAKPVGVVVPADLLAPGIVLDYRQPSHLPTPVHDRAIE